MTGRVCILTPDASSEGYRTRWRDVLERNSAPLRAAGLEVEHRDWARADDGALSVQFLTSRGVVSGLVPVPAPAGAGWSPVGASVGADNRTRVRWYRSPGGAEAISLLSPTGAVEGVAEVPQPTP